MGMRSVPPDWTACVAEVDRVVREELVNVDAGAAAVRSVLRAG
jgi:hypothetical protein